MSFGWATGLHTNALIPSPPPLFFLEDQTGAASVWLESLCGTYQDAYQLHVKETEMCTHLTRLVVEELPPFPCHFATE